MPAAPGRINSHKLALRVVGFDAVDAGLAENALRCGHPVTGVATEAARVDAIRRAANSHLAFLSVRADENLQLTHEPTADIRHDAAFVCVPTLSERDFDAAKFGAALDALNVVLAPGTKQTFACKYNKPDHLRR